MANGDEPIDTSNEEYKRRKAKCDSDPDAPRCEHLAPRDLSENANGSDYSKMGIVERAKAALRGIDPYTGKAKK